MKRKDFTPEEVRKIQESAMNNCRVSMAIEGKYISDADWEKIKRIADRLDKII